ncbi:hypothetical protein Golax_003439, partial [Gossypium laxum]|nr:hypothetical protein [Gossypium laxum]
MKLRENALCPICKMEKETVTHLFRDFTFTKLVMHVIGVAPSSTNRDQNWKQWNKFYHEEVRERVQDVVRFIKAYISEIEQLGELSKFKHIRSKDSWEPPEEEM